MVLQVVYKLCPTSWAVLGQAVHVDVGVVEHVGGAWVALVVLDVLLVVAAQALPRGGVEEERDHLQDDGHTHVQAPVRHVVVQQAGTPGFTLSAPKKAG